MAEMMHKNLAAGRWGTFSLMTQLANIGSEVSRAIAWHRKSVLPTRDKAIDRALELFDLTIADARWKNRLKEITRARETVCDLFYGDNIYQTSFASLERYFLQFGIAARCKPSNI
jgi:hypothetical protein